jgi:DNA-binding transcriptional ArsR family regulator
MPHSHDPLEAGLAGRVAELLGVFSDTNRVRIVWQLIQGEISVGDLARAVEMSESAVSHHLRQLRQLRLAQVRKDGRQAFYRVDDDHIVALLQQVVEHVQHA